MTEIITHYVVVSDDAPEEAICEAVRIKAKMLEADINLYGLEDDDEYTAATNLHDIRVVRKCELRQWESLDKLEAEL